MCIIYDTVQKNNTVKIKPLPVRENKIPAGNISDKFTGYKMNGGAAICLGHTNLKRDSAKWSTASEREWQPPMAERCLKEDAPKAEIGFPIDSIADFCGERTKIKTGSDAGDSKFRKWREESIIVF